jgi:DNA end-binding protein Ku
MKSWRNATLNFAITPIAVGVNPAIEKDKSFSFSLLHDKCKTHVQQRYFCPVCNEWAEEISRGIEFPKGNYTPVTSEEISSTFPPVKNIINLTKFSHEEMVNPLLLGDPYWLIPREHNQAIAYAALKETMMVKRQVGIGRAAFNDKEHAVCVAAQEDGLVLWMLHHAEQLRAPDWQPLPSPSALELKATEQILELMSDSLTDEDLTTPTKARQEELRAKKLDGVQIEPLQQEDGNHLPVVNVMDTLADSIKWATAQKKSRKRKVAK